MLDLRNLFYFGLTFVVVSCKSENVNVRGVSDNNLQRYVGVNGQFTCFDNLKTVPIQWVNDDYCDCFDGSDEPGTSACFNSVFYCRNRGYQQKYVYGVFVDDGVCDCCDGSDESVGSCNNTCVDKGKTELDKLFREAQGYTKGLQLKEQMIRDGLGKKSGWENELQQMEQFIDQKRPILEQLKEKRDKLQSEEDERQRVIREQEEAEKKKREEEEAARKATEEATITQEQPPPEQQGEQENKISSEEQSQGTADQQKKIKLNLEGFKKKQQDKQEEEGEGEEKKEEELSQEELGKKIASQWTHNPEAVGDVEDTHDISGEEMMLFDDDDDDYDHEIYHHQGEQTAEGEGQEVAQEKPGILGRMMQSAKKIMSNWGGSSSEKDTTNKSDDSKTHQDAHPELTAAKKDFEAVENEVKDAEKRVKELEAKLVMDFGSQNEFMSLADECFETKVDKYVYKICPFHSASQDHTSLGSFRGFEENYSRMIFDKGASCWSGPARSMKVRLTCGVENEFTQIEEPSRCEYAGLFFTPLACTKEQAEDVTNRYTQLEAELKQVELTLKHDEL